MKPTLALACPVVRSSRIVLVVFSLMALLLALVYVPRLANPLWSDVEFTGWVSPIAHRMVEGQRIYRDFTLPIPPGSFVVMAWIQRILGRFRLVDELWLCAVSQLLMTGIGYWMVRPFTGPRNAALVAVGTWPLLIATPKEIAYDHTALVIAWGSVALLGWALSSQAEKKRTKLMAAAGFVAGATLAFKSSTGVGASAGLVVGLLFASWVQLRRQGWKTWKVLRKAWLAAAAGGLSAGILTLVWVAALGGSVGEFYRTVFVDGPALKGGRGQAFFNLFSYAVLQPPVQVSLLSAVFLAYLLSRSLRSSIPLQVTDSRAVASEPETWRETLKFALPVSVYVVWVLWTGFFLLAANAPGIPPYLHIGAGFGQAVPMIGLLVLILWFGSNLGAARQAFEIRSAFVAVVADAGVVSLMHNLSDPKHRPLYDNNPIIPLAILVLLLWLDQARARILKGVVWSVLMLSLFGGKFYRYLQARIPIRDHGYWHGLRVSTNGRAYWKAAKQARELAGPRGTVLVLPEDPMFESLIGRPRPALKGAIVFVDQFPSHVLQQGIRELDQHPPKVVVLHPKDPKGWHAVYSIWSNHSPAAALQTTFWKRHRNEYREAGTYPSWLFKGPDKLVVMVRKD